MKNPLNRTYALIAMAAMLGGAGLMAAANKYGKPKSVIHVVTIKWKEGTTPEQKDAAIKAVDKVAENYAGIRNIWTKKLKVQGKGYEHALVMEFENQDALAKYTDSDAQKEWYKIYLPIREESTTHDITNCLSFEKGSGRAGGRGPVHFPSIKLSSSRARDPLRLQTLGPLLHFELHLRSVVQSAIPVHVNRTEMDKHVFSRGSLDKPVALCIVEPLHDAFFSHYFFS
jgi:hypothetical protein